MVFGCAFFGRILYDALHIKLKMPVVIILCLVLSVAGVLIGVRVKLPFSFDVVLACMPFLLLGQLWRQCRRVNDDRNDWRIWLLFTILWAFTLWITFYVSGKQLDLSCRWYPLYPLCMLTAVFGTEMICGISKWISRVKWPSKILAGVGRYSMELLCIHYADKYWIFLWGRVDNPYLQLIIRYALDLVILVIVIKIKRMWEIRHAAQS